MTQGVRNDRIRSRHLLRRNYVRRDRKITDRRAMEARGIKGEQMRKIEASVFIGVSLDGFIARTDGSLDWLPPDCEPHGYDEFMATVDSLVIGRKTFEKVLTFDAWPYGAKPVFALSSSPLPPAPAGAVVARMSGDLSEI